MRGKDVPRIVHVSNQRITPAYAGKRYSFEPATRSKRDHPRLCGEKDQNQRSKILFLGSPPPMRGKGKYHIISGLLLRITPAYAGKRTEGSFSYETSRDHPRLCGEKYREALSSNDDAGSPPPMRGKVRESSDDFFLMKDHPRLCGEKNRRSGFPHTVQGSPPPMRGKAH